jgi:formylglycine-generating enzyme required for sulfatase activity
MVLKTWAAQNDISTPNERVHVSKIPELLPPPFDWVEIPDKGYSIAKYPVTHAQYAEFIKAGGYSTIRWWTKGGLAWKKSEENVPESEGGFFETDPLRVPNFWNDSRFKGDSQPVVGVSWFEAVAFCLWLSEVTSEDIMLPTSTQWQYAAQGDDGREYPWGSQWAPDLCNHNVDSKGVGQTTPVTQYEGLGDSFFGVVDMAGNVWEWCLNDQQQVTQQTIDTTMVCACCGGSWNSSSRIHYSCAYRNHRNPSYRYSRSGFRITARQ